MALELLENYFLWLMFYSFVGWVYESLLCSFSARRWINRGFLNGPYCPIYGFGAVLDLLILGRITQPVLLFFLGALVTCTLEYLTSYVMEKLFHARWWDYSERKFNLNGRVCLIGAVVFGAFSVVLILLIHPAVARATAWLPPLARHILSAALLVLLLTDTAVTVGGFSGFNRRLKELSVLLEQAKTEAADRLHRSLSHSALYRSFTEKLNRQQRRMLAAFPKLKSVSYNHLLSGLKQAVRERRGKKAPDGTSDPSDSLTGVLNETPDESLSQDPNGAGKDTAQDA